MVEEKKSSVVYAKKVINYGGGSGAIYGLGIIGALIYYLQHAATFLAGIIGIIKAIFWPAVIVFKILEIWKL